MPSGIPEVETEIDLEPKPKSLDQSDLPDFFDLFPI